MLALAPDAGVCVGAGKKRHSEADLGNEETRHLRGGTPVPMMGGRCRSPHLLSPKKSAPIVPVSHQDWFWL
jgi:hypothetical protein